MCSLAVVNAAVLRVAAYLKIICSMEARGLTRRLPAGGSAVLAPVKYGAGVAKFSSRPYKASKIYGNFVYTVILQC